MYVPYFKIRTTVIDPLSRFQFEDISVIFPGYFPAVGQRICAYVLLKMLFFFNIFK